MAAADNRRAVRRPDPIPPGPGQESAWDYPRPPRLEAATTEIVVVLDGTRLAATARSLRVLETSHPPVHYIPRDDVDMSRLALEPGRRSYCEYKGVAVYWGAPGHPEIAWSYPEPAPRYAALRDHLAFYPGRVDSVTLDGEVVVPQAGGFYGGWITTRVVGPFKGGPGTEGW